MSQFYKEFHNSHGQAIHPYRVGPALTSLSPLGTVRARFPRIRLEPPVNTARESIGIQSPSKYSII